MSCTANRSPGSSNRRASAMLAVDRSKPVTSNPRRWMNRACLPRPQARSRNRAPGAGARVLSRFSTNASASAWSRWLYKIGYHGESNHDSNHCPCILGIRLAELGGHLCDFFQGIDKHAKMLVFDGTFHEAGDHTHIMAVFV